MIIEGKRTTHEGEHKWISGDQWCQVWNCEARYFEWSQAEIQRLKHDSLELLEQHAAIRNSRIIELEDENARLTQQLAAQREVLVRLLQWDHFDGAADGPYWRREISAAITRLAAVLVNSS
jgi:hypothetical protein